MSSEFEREIDLVDMLFYVLQKWKLYILVGVIALLVLGAFKYCMAEQERNENNRLVSEGRENEVIYSSDYQAALDALETKEREIRDYEESITKNKADISGYSAQISKNRDAISTNQEKIALLETEQAEIERKLQELQSYMDNTLLLHIDATSRPTARRIYQVIYGGENPEALFRDPVDEILGAYTQNISLIGAGSGLDEKYGVEEKYLDEMFSASYDSVSNSIIVTAKGIDRNMAEEIREAVCKIIEDRKKGMTNRYHAHSLKTVSETYTEVVDENLANTQSSRYNMENSYKSQVASYDAQILSTNTSNVNLEIANESLERQISDANERIREFQDDIVKTEKKIIEDKLRDKVLAKAPSSFRSLKDGIKFGIIGAVVLAFLTAAVFGMIYLMDGRMHTASDLADTYRIVLLAVLNRPAAKKGCFIDRWIYRMRNKGCAVPDEEIIRTAAVTASGLIGENRRIGILSSLEPDALSAITASLRSLIAGVEFVPVAEPFRSAVSAKELNDVDAVILYEKRETSRLAEVERELMQTKLLKKDILGGIVA